MATTALVSPASTLVSNNRTSCSLSPAPIGLGQRSALLPTPSFKAPSSRPSLVVRAQQGGAPDQFHKKVALVETSPFVRTPWNTSEDKSEIRMWFNMPGLEAENINVDVIDDLLVIKGDGGLDAYGNKVFSPQETTLHIPFNSWKRRYARNWGWLGGKRPTSHGIESLPQH